MPRRGVLRAKTPSAHGFKTRRVRVTVLSRRLVRLVSLMSHVVLLVGLETGAADSVSRHLSEGRLQAVVVDDGAHVPAAIDAHRPAAVVLQHPLVDLAGTEVLKRIRRRERLHDVPVILVSHHAHEIDRVIAFEIGADDFLGEPCSHRELALRVRALVRRSRPAPIAQPELVAVGPFEIDMARHDVAVDGASVPLTLLEFRLLLELARHRGRVQRRDELLERVWRHTGEVDPRTVDTHVKRLRDKLGAAGRWIQTVRGVGYRMRDVD